MTTQSFDQLFPTINSVSASGIIRSQADDFIVLEHNDIEFTESGEHLWLKVEKTNSNTAWVATQISSACKVPARQVGYAGLKDRHAITQQWFSVQLPKIRELDEIKAKLPDEVKIIEHHWHKSKIKTGFLTCNEFRLKVRNITGDTAQINHNIATLMTQGAPNYFGPQRFGHHMGNIEKANDWFSGKTKVNNKNLRGLLISTARSHIFNQILAYRIKNNTWDQVIDGDIIQLNGSHSWFHANDATNNELTERLAAFDIHLTAALWGEDGVQSSANCAELEQNNANEFPIYQQGFKLFRVKQDRRAIRVVPMDLSHTWDNEDLLLNFKLLPGAYATGILREILSVTDCSHDAE